ncbi:MAG: hypothetical protein R2879_19665 [Saprospiraceae bacterium]
MLFFIKIEKEVKAFKIPAIKLAVQFQIHYSKFIMEEAGFNFCGEGTIGLGVREIRGL